MVTTVDTNQAGRADGLGDGRGTNVVGPARLCFAGAVSSAAQGGGTVKNALVVETLMRHGTDVGLLDTGVLQTEGLRRLPRLMSALSRERQVLLSLSERGTKVLVPYMWVLKALKGDVRFALMVVGSGLASALERMPSPLRAPFTRSLEACSAIYVETEPLAATLRGQGFTNVVVLPNPRPSPGQAWRGPSVDRKRVIFISRLTETKGVADAAAAVSAARRQGIDVQLNLYGPLEEGFEERLAEIVAREEACTYHGTVAPEKVTELLASYDAMLLPTYWPTEGMPGVLVEAAMVGLPIISSRFNGVEDLIHHNVHGLLVEARDVEALTHAVIRVLSEDGLAGRLSAAARERARAFSIDEVVGNLRADLRQRGWS